MTAPVNEIKDRSDLSPPLENRLLTTQASGFSQKELTSQHGHMHLQSQWLNDQPSDTAVEGERSK